VWDGILLEDDVVVPRPGVVETIRHLDSIGILHSIASRNDHAAAMQRLEELGLADYFLAPQIGWHPKSRSVRDIATALNIGLDALAFVDDQPFELEEVRFHAPEVLTVPVEHLAWAVTQPVFSPRFVTPDARQRRALYRANEGRTRAEQDFEGTDEEFLATLGLRLTIAPAGSGDLERAEELTVRTNQLNSTGLTFDYDELERLRRSPDHLLLVAGLEDRFGSYGTIGLALVATSAPSWRLQLMLMSCRVVSRGVGTVVLNHIMRSARDAGSDLLADFVHTGRNRLMFVTYMFAGFIELERDGDVSLLHSTLEHIQEPPAYLDVELR
jgi:FkbH-like protein